MYDQNKPLYPQPVQWRKGVAFSLGLACLMFALAAHVWLSKVNPCIGGQDKHCNLAQFWAQVIGVPRYLADAQFWGVLGLMMMLIAYQLWKHRDGT